MLQYKRLHEAKRISHFAYSVGFDILTTMVMKMVLCDVTSCSVVEIYRRFSRTYFLFLQGISQRRKHGKFSTTPWRFMGIECIDPSFVDLSASWR
jgi:hypothetical protein